MSYDADSTKTQQPPVVGSAPLSQGGGSTAPTPVDSGTSNGPTTPSTIQPAQSNQPSPQGKSPASSGMFTNIQKYVNRNKPQAKNIAKAVTKDFGKQAEQINQIAQQKKQEQEAALQSGQNIMQRERQEAQNIVSNIVNTPNQQATTPQATTPQATAPQATAPILQQSDKDRFQQLMSGSGAQDVSDLNLSKQNMKAQALQNLAKTARSEEGRRNLMGETFGKRDYTRGQSSLDNLILGGDKEAQAGLIGDVQSKSQDVQENLQSLGQQSKDDIGQYNRQVDQFGQQIGDIARSEVDPLKENIQSEYEKAVIDRAILTGGIDNLPDDIKSKLTPEQLQSTGMSFQDAANLSHELSKITNKTYNTQGAGSGTYWGNKRLKRKGDLLFGSGVDRKYSDEALSKLGIDTGRFSELQEAYKAYRTGKPEDFNKINLKGFKAPPPVYLSDKELYKFKYDPRAKQDYINTRNAASTFAHKRKYLDSQLKDIASKLNKAEDVDSVVEQLRDSGYNAADIQAGRDISLGNVAGARADQVNQLNELLGLQDRIDKSDKETYSTEAIKNILNRYR